MKIFKNKYRLTFFILASTLLLTGCPGEGCYKRYFITGVVTDVDTNPLADVEIFMSETLLATSSLDGSYEILYPAEGSTMANFGGDILKFVMPGYITYEAEPFSSSEAGTSRCGYVELKRDAVLQVE